MNVFVGGLPPSVAIAIFGLLMVMVLVGAMLYQMSFGPRARLERRMASVVGASQKKGRAAASGGARKRQTIKLKDRDQTKKKSYMERLQDDIAQAGLAVTPGRFLLISAVVAVVSTAAYMLYGLPRIGAPFFLITAGVGLPRFFLNFRRKRRVQKFIALFPDALDVIVRGIKSGLPVGECINLIGREMPDPVGTEFRLLAEAQRLGMSMDEALKRTTDRVPNPELRFFAIVLMIQQQTGGNLADTLAKLSDVLRQRKKMRDKVQAMSSEAKASASIIGSLPIIVTALLAFVASDYIGLLFSTSTGHMLIGAGLGVMGFGVFVMRQMINFDI